MELVETITFALTLFAALTCGLVGGVFFAFSTFIMKALGRIPAEAGIAAMQSINITVITPWFLGPFLLAAAACVGIVAVALLNWRGPVSLLLLSGAMLYLVGSILVTFVFNIPRNNALASLAPADPASATYWADYVSSWTFWNSVRTAAALGAAAVFLTALLD